MRHFQYRIRERIKYNGNKEYVVEWRDDWFGSGIFWFSIWYVCREYNSQLRFCCIIFNTIEEARDYLDKRKAEDEHRERAKIAKERTVEYNPK